MWSFRWPGSGLSYEPGDALGDSCRKTIRRLVVEVLRAAGLEQDGALHEALARRYDISTLTAKQMKDYAALTGDKRAGRAGGGCGASAASFLPGGRWSICWRRFRIVSMPEEFTSLLRPLAPRYYSIASSQKLVGEEAHLTVARLAYESAGRARLGVASTHGRRTAARSGGSLNVFVKPNPHFRLPKDAAAPIVMIGAGTGDCALSRLSAGARGAGCNGAGLAGIRASAFSLRFSVPA